MTKSAREALKDFEFDNGGFERVIVTSPENILTALRDHLRTPGTVEVCKMCRWQIGEEGSCGSALHPTIDANCPIRAAKEQ